MMSTASPEPVLSIRQLSVTLPAGSDRAHAVHKVSLTIHPGQTLCVVGESGSGKSVMATTVMGLLAKELRPSGGEIVLQGESLLNASASRLRALRGRSMGMVFQEPMTALNPVMTCGDQVDELLSTHTDWPRDQRRAEILRIFERVRLPDPERMLRS
jgi:peptide/nickel transport system ATP-binding protein